MTHISLTKQKCSFLKVKFFELKEIMNYQKKNKRSFQIGNVYNLKQIF